VPSGLLAGYAQGPEKIFSIQIIVKNFLTPIRLGSSGTKWLSRIEFAVVRAIPRLNQMENVCQYLALTPSLPPSASPQSALQFAFAPAQSLPLA
jgi:hypothetical protein